MKIKTLIQISKLFLFGISLYFMSGCEHEQNDAISILQDSVIMFNPILHYGIVTDIDGNEYKTIKIGSQTWMAENLKVFRYRNGNIIDYSEEESDDDDPEYQWPYEDDEDFVPLFGRLYTWHTINDNRNIAPFGWHVATMNDWETLINFLDGETVAGGKLKEKGSSHWLEPNEGATNESGFTALPGGGCNNRGDFWGIGTQCSFFSATSYDKDYALGVSLGSNYKNITKDKLAKNYGYYVRCVLDN